MGELGVAVLGCSHTNMPGSRFCYECRSAAARCVPTDRCSSISNADSITKESSDDLAGPSSASGNEPDIHTEPTETATDQIADRELDIEAIDSLEEGTFLVEKLLESRSALRVNESETCRSQSIKKCMRSRHTEYLVKFVGYDVPSWICHCDIGSSALKGGISATDSKEGVTAAAEHAERAAALLAERTEDTAEWRGKHTSNHSSPPSAHTYHTRHAGMRAASLADASSGDFKPTDDDTNKECDNNLKENQYAGKLFRTSAGILALVSSCGLFLAADELIGSESLTQVHLFLFAIFFIHDVPPPAVLAYDDACHLLRFWQLRQNKSKFVQWLLGFKNLQVVVDRFHFRNHVGKFCKKWVNPAKCAALGADTSTETAEQSFSWLARSKHVFRHMGEGRFQFMTLHLMEMRNQFLVQQARMP
jgi:hypothetical protein